MNKTDMLYIANRNLNKAERSLRLNSNRSGITEQERNNLIRNVEYHQSIIALIDTYIKDD